MRSLIREILKEEFQNPEVMSQEKNICDIMTANSWEEIQSLLDVMEYDNKFQKQIDDIKYKMEKEMSYLGSDRDIVNNYLREIQNIICR
jgi:hypothetical protein